MNTNQDIFLCVRRQCGQPVEVTTEAARIFRYHQQPAFGQVVVDCQCCGATNELPPGELMDLAVSLGCPERDMGSRTTSDQVEAFEANTGLKVITINQPLTASDIGYLEGLAALTDVPASEYDLPSPADDLWNRWLLCIVAEDAL